MKTFTKDQVDRAILKMRAAHYAKRAKLITDLDLPCEFGEELADSILSYTECMFREEFQIEDGLNGH